MNHKVPYLGNMSTIHIACQKQKLQQQHYCTRGDALVYVQVPNYGKFGLKEAFKTSLFDMNI